MQHLPRVRAGMHNITNLDVRLSNAVTTWTISRLPSHVHDMGLMFCMRFERPARLACSKAGRLAWPSESFHAA